MGMWGKLDIPVLLGNGLASQAKTVKVVTKNRPQNQASVQQTSLGIQEVATETKCSNIEENLLSPG